MPKIETLKDLMIAGEITRGDMARIARRLFNGTSCIDDNSIITDAYEIRLPRFEDLPDREQSYLIKVLLECPIANRLDREIGQLGPENTELDSELLDTSDADSTRTSLERMSDDGSPPILDDYQR